MTRSILIGTGLLVLATATPAQARNDKAKVIAPYIEIGQVVTADLQTDDVLTYTTVAAGIGAEVHTRQADVQVSYRYERRISYDKRVGDDDVHSGLALATVKVAPGLSVEAGAIATRVRSDIRGAAPGNLAGNVDNISQVYSAYVGPTLATHVGPVGVAASYRYGYTKAEAPGATGVAPGSPKLDVFDSAQSHVVNVSAGTKAGTVLPVGVNVAAAYERDTASQLSQRYETKLARGDVVLPVLPTLALTAGAGYEKITVSQKDAVRDATGAPVTDRNGRFQTDQASPRRIAYQTDGLIYDAGIIWRPSSRTTLQARAGHRYGGMTYTGSLSYAASRSLGIQVGVYDSVDTFGRQLRNGLSNLPASFIDQRDAFGQQFSGCTFGAASSAAGGCLTGVFQSISTAAYRSRGIDAVVAAKRGPVSFGVGGGYANRRFSAPATGGFTIDGTTDQSYYLEGFVGVPIDRNSGVNATVIGNYYESGIAAAPGVYSTAATGSYYHNFGRISTTATAGIYAFSQQGTDDQRSAQGQVAVRYQF